MMRLEISDDGERIRGAVTSKLMGLESAPMQEVRWANGQLWARWDSAAGPWSLSARATVERFVGVLRFKGVDFALIFGRAIEVRRAASASR
jgi:hypothetical protein